MALVSLKVTTPNQIAGGGQAVAPTVQSARVTVPQAIGLTLLAGGVGPSGATGPPGVGASWKGLWSSGTTYAIGDGVQGSDGHNYISVVGSNLNHNPVGDAGVHWSDLLPSTVVSGASDQLVAAKGDLMAGAGAGVRARLAAGANGAFLTPDSTQTDGLAWNTFPVVYAAAPSGGDDAAALQALLTALNSAGGGVLELRAATYLVSTPLLIPNFVTVRGQGQTTLVRATGNTYVFAYGAAAGNRSAIRHLSIDAQTTQTGGGGIDFTNAGNNIALSGLYLGSNLKNGLLITPSSGSGGIYWIDRIRWNGVTSCGTAITIGDDTNLVTDVKITRCMGTAATTADMTAWLVINNNTDTIHVSNSLFYRGAAGGTIGQAAAGTTTNGKLVNVTFDTMTGTGLAFGKCNGYAVIDVTASTCANGVTFAASANLVRLIGGQVQGNTGTGIILFSGCTNIDLNGVVVADNNTSNGGFGHGIDIGTCTDFKIVGCRSGNSLLGASGHQVYGIQTAAGVGTNRYIIQANALTGNGTAGLNDQGTGATKSVTGNI